MTHRARTPTVAIVGRPNVGKSTLFNRLLGRRKAIVHDMPGVTRDRLTGITSISTDRSIVLIDTGGLVSGEDPLGVNQSVLIAVEEADLLLLVVDGKSGLTAADEQIWDALRGAGKPTILVINKAETNLARDGQYEFYRLGIEPQLLASAEHNLGIEEIREAIAVRLDPVGASEAVEEGLRIAIVGRPNVGKSSLLNQLVGQPRALVAAEPGTTRDPIDTHVEWGDQHLILVDTAGIRKRSRVSDAPEEIAVMMARRQIEDADLALLVVDASVGITSGDLAIAGIAWELGRPSLVVLNKWDLVAADRRERLEISWERVETLMSGPSRLNVSALTGRGVGKIFPALLELHSRSRLEISTAELNRLLGTIVSHHRPPAIRGKPWKVLYATQVRSAPPTFMVFANRALPRAGEYRRYLENSLRSALGLQGIPLRLVVRRRSEGDR